LRVCEVNDVRQTEIHTAEQLVPEPNASEVAMVIEKLKRHESPLLIKSQKNLLNQGVEQFALRYVNLSIQFGIRRNCLWSGRSRSYYLSIKRVIKRIVLSADAYHSC
jgi:hypothetical protein